MMILQVLALTLARLSQALPAIASPAAPIARDSELSVTSETRKSDCPHSSPPRRARLTSAGVSNLDHERPVPELLAFKCRRRVLLDDRTTGGKSEGARATPSLKEQARRASTVGQ
eukprot:3142908-Rhodomonas_salina.1